MVKDYNTISCTFLISNLIAMPLLGISIIGGYLIVIFSFVWLWGIKQIGLIFNLLLKALIIITKFCGNLKLSNIYVINPSGIIIVFYYISIYIIFLINNDDRSIRPHIKKSLMKIRCIRVINKTKIIIFLIILIIEIPFQNYNGKLKIYFIDVGQRR